MTVPYTKKLIEVALPLEVINAASIKEKSAPSLKGHPRSLHLWWSRKPLAACRAVLFAQLVDDPSSHPDKFPTEAAVTAERKRLFGIIEELVKWKNSTNEALLEAARAEIAASCGEPLPPVFDPFSGGGSIPLEAQRLGLPAYGSDLNPVAVMIGKAMIEIPPRFKDCAPVHPGTRKSISTATPRVWPRMSSITGNGCVNGPLRTSGTCIPRWTCPRPMAAGRRRPLPGSGRGRCPSPDPAFSDVQVPLASSFELSSKEGKEALGASCGGPSGQDYWLRGSSGRQRGGCCAGQGRKWGGVPPRGSGKGFTASYRARPCPIPTFAQRARRGRWGRPLSLL